MFASRKTEMVAPANALAGRAQPIPTAAMHHVFGGPLSGDVPQGFEQTMFGMSCFWCASGCSGRSPAYG